MVSAYHMVSELALVIAGVLLIDLLAHEQKVVHQQKSEIDGYTACIHAKTQKLEGWQRCWEQEEQGHRMRKLIKRMKPEQRRNMGIDYYLTKFLNCHRYFWSYLSKVCKAVT